MPEAFSNAVLPDALGALPPETPVVVSVPRGTTTFTLGAPLPTVVPRTEGVTGAGLTVIGWPTPAAVGNPLGVITPAFTFGATPLGMETCAPPPTPMPPSEPPALP